MNDEQNINIKNPLYNPSEKSSPPLPLKNNRKKKQKLLKKEESPNLPLHNNFTIDEAPELQTEAEQSDVESSSHKLTFLFLTGTTTESILTMISYSPILLYLSLPFLGHTLGIMITSLLTILFLCAVLFSLLIIIRIMIEKKYKQYISILDHLTLNNRSLYYVINCLSSICYYIISTSISSEISFDLYERFNDSFKLNKVISTMILCLFIIIIIAIHVVLFFIKKENYTFYIKLFQYIIMLLCIISYLFILIFNGNIPKTNPLKTRNKFLLNLSNPLNYSVIIPILNLVLFNQENLFNEATHLKAFTKKRGEILIYKTITVQGIIIIIISILGIFVPYEEEESLIFIYRIECGLKNVDIVYRCLFLILCCIEGGFIWKKVIESALLFSEKEMPKVIKGVITVVGICLVNVGMMILKMKGIAKNEEILICLLGGICAGLICYYFPGRVYLNLMKERIKKGNKKKIFGLIVLMVVLGSVSTVIGVSGFIRKAVMRNNMQKS